MREGGGEMVARMRWKDHGEEVKLFQDVMYPFKNPLLCNNLPG